MWYSKIKKKKWKNVRVVRGIIGIEMQLDIICTEMKSKRLTVISPKANIKKIIPGLTLNLGELHKSFMRAFICLFYQYNNSYHAL